MEQGLQLEQTGSGRVFVSLQKSVDVSLVLNQLVLDFIVHLLIIIKGRQSEGKRGWKVSPKRNPKSPSPLQQ